MKRYHPLHPYCYSHRTLPLNYFDVAKSTFFSSPKPLLFACRSATFISKIFFQQFLSTYWKRHEWKLLKKTFFILKITHLFRWIFLTSEWRSELLNAVQLNSWLNLASTFSIKMWFTAVKLLVFSSSKSLVLQGMPYFIPSFVTTNHGLLKTWLTLWISLICMAMGKYLRLSLHNRCISTFLKQEQPMRVTDTSKKALTKAYPFQNIWPFE